MFTTFTRNLATDIRNNLTKICTPEELQIIDVQHLDGWVLNFLKGQGLPVRVFDENAKTTCWDMAMSMEDTSLCLDRRFYEEEWNSNPIGLLFDLIKKTNRYEEVKKDQIWKRVNS